MSLHTLAAIGSSTPAQTAERLERKAQAEFAGGDGVFYNGLQYVPMKLLLEATAAIRQAGAAPRCDCGKYRSNA